MKELFKNKNFSLLFFGFFVSRVGNTLFNFAIAWYMYRSGIKPSIVSMYLATGLIITLVLSPFTGVLADRVSKKSIIYISDFIRGITVLVSGYLFFGFNNQEDIIVLLFITTIILSINSSFFVPASGSLVPEVVGDENLQKANGAFTMISSFQTIFGVLLGATFFQVFGIEMIFIINGVTFIVSGISEIFIRVNYEKKRDVNTGVKGYFTDLVEGGRYLINDKGLLHLLIGVILLNFAMTPLFSNGFPYLFSTVLNTNSYHLSFVNVTSAVGALIGGVYMGTKTISNLKKTINTGLLIELVLFILIGIGIYLIVGDVISYILFFIVFLIVIFALGIFNMVVNVPLNTSFMRSIEVTKRGRIMGITMLAANGTTPLALVIGGYILEFGGIMYMVYFSVLTSTIMILYFIISKPISDLLDRLGNQ